MLAALGKRDAPAEFSTVDSVVVLLCLFVLWQHRL